MFSRKLYNVWIFTLWWIIFLYPYVFNSTYFPIWWDWGQYFDVLTRFLRSDSFLLSTDYWYEPGFFYSLASYIKVSWISPIAGVKVFLINLFLLNTLFTYLLITKTLFKNTISATIVSSFISFSVNLFYIFMFKQYMGQVFLIAFLYIFFLTSSNRKILFSTMFTGALFLSFVFYAHRWITLGTGVFWFVLFLIYFKNAWMRNMLLIFWFWAVLFYGPFLSKIIPLELKTVSDFAAISSNNLVKASWSGLGQSIIGPGGQNLNQVYAFILYNPVIWIYTLSAAIYILNRHSLFFKKKSIMYAVSGLTLISIFLVHYRLNFSSRFTSLIFIFLSIWWSAAYNLISKKHRVMTIFAITLIVCFWVIDISKKSFYVSRVDSAMEQFQQKINPDNSLIATAWGVSLLPSYLGYTTTLNSNPVHINPETFMSDSVQKELIQNYGNYLLTHPEAPKKLSILKDKQVYVVIWLFLDNYTLGTMKVQSNLFFSSPYYEPIMNLNYYHPFRYVFRLKTDLLKEEYSVSL